MLIYSGVRVSEMLDLKKENVNLKEHTFTVIKSKTKAGTNRKVPIADKVFKFYEAWFNHPCEYLVCTEDEKHFEYRNFYDAYFCPTVKKLGMNHKCHDTRHTCESLLQQIDDPPINQTVIDKILGHQGAGASIGELVYTHLDVETILKAINKI